MKDLPTPKPGQPIRAQDAQEHLRGTKAALNWSVDGVDLEQHGSGKAAVVRPKESLQLVEIVTRWYYVPKEQDTEQRPTAWHYCEAYLLQRGLGEGKAWARKQPEERICLWAPTAYPGGEVVRNSLRGYEPPHDNPPPPPFAEGDWVWATYHHASGLWLLVSTYDRFWPGVTKTAWEVGEGAEVYITFVVNELSPPYSPYSIVVRAVDELRFIRYCSISVSYGSGKFCLPAGTRVFLYQRGGRFILVGVGEAFRSLWGRIVDYRPIPSLVGPTKIWEYTFFFLYDDHLFDVVQRCQARLNLDQRGRISRYAIDEWTDGTVLPSCYNLAEIGGKAGDLYLPSDQPVLPVPKGTIVQILPCRLLTVSGETETVYLFSMANNLGGLTKTLTYQGLSLELRSGHIVDAAISDYGPIQVDGPDIPLEVRGQFFPVPGQWNGMPQWRHAQNPNWWIRWQPAPGAGGGGAGGWIIGHWPPGAQEPDKGWRKHPLPEPGQPADPNPIGTWPEPVGDVTGQPVTSAADYVLKDCDTSELYLLLQSSYLRLQLNEVVLLKDDLGAYHCAQIQDLPDLLAKKLSQWRIYWRFRTCADCPREDPVIQLCDGSKKIRLKGSRRFLWQPGTVVRFAYAPGTVYRYHCGIVVSGVQPDETVEEGYWTVNGVFPTCTECYGESWPLEPSSPTEPCQHHYTRLEAYGDVSPPDVVGIYTCGGADQNGYCWWRKGDWVIERDLQYGWFVVNINAPTQWWLHPRPNDGPLARYMPGPGTAGYLNINQVR